MKLHPCISHNTRPLTCVFAPCRVFPSARNEIGLQSGLFCRHSSAAGRVGLPFLACLVLSLSLLLFLLFYGFLTFGYISTCSPPNPALENAHNESGLLFLLTLGLRNKAAHLNNAHCFLTLSRLFVTLILLSPPPVSPVTSSLLSPSLSSPFHSLFLLCVPRTAYHAGKGKHQFTRKGITHLNIASLTHIDFYFRR